MKFSGDEFNEILQELYENGIISDSEYRQQKIEDGLLKGYKIKTKTDGDHKNDGQMVEYTFKFTSPKGKISEVVTEMCLMVGWNHWEDVTIK